MAAQVPSSRKSRFYPTAVLLMLIAIYLSTSLCSATDTDREKEIAFQAILQRMEQKVLALRDEFERVYQFRCDTTTLDQCGRNNYNDCYSSYPDAECAAGDEFFEIQCENGETCPGEYPLRVIIYWCFGITSALIFLDQISFFSQRAGTSSERR